MHIMKGKQELTSAVFTVRWFHLDGAVHLEKFFMLVLLEKNIFIRTYQSFSMNESVYLM
jgi:hypothetical protein